MAIHSSTIAWKISWTEEPGRLQSMGSQSRTRLSDLLHQRSMKGDKRKAGRKSDSKHEKDLMCHCSFETRSG